MLPDPASGEHCVHPTQMPAPLLGPAPQRAAYQPRVFKWRCSEAHCSRIQYDLSQTNESVVWQKMSLVLQLAHVIWLHTPQQVSLMVLQSWRDGVIATESRTRS